VHREPFVGLWCLPAQAREAKRVRLSEVGGQDLVMYERTHAPGFHDLVFGSFANAGNSSPCQSDCGGNAHTDLVGICRKWVFPFSPLRRSDIALPVRSRLRDSDATPMSEIVWP